MWFKALIFGARFPVGGALALVASAGAASVFGVYARERRVDVDTLLLTAGSWGGALAIWPGEKRRATFSERHAANGEGDLPIWLVPAIGAAFTLVLGVGIVAGSVLVTQVQALTGENERLTRILDDERSKTQQLAAAIETAEDATFRMAIFHCLTTGRDLGCVAETLALAGARVDPDG